MGINPKTFDDIVCVRGIRPDLKRCKNWPPELTELIGRCWGNDIHSRPSFTEVVKQLSEIDHRWKEAIRTDQLKLQLMKSKAGEVSDFLQRQIMDKQARNQAERIKRLTTPDVFARTGYPPINSPTRDLMAAEVKMMQKSAIKAALSDQMQLKKDLDDYSKEKSMNDELVKLKALATQLEVCGADGAAARHGDRPH